ncbi:MAG: hypothetical protein LBV51_00010 [Acholeplasmatales bacterium]|jgi:hypothetical protein|nr:hypothetical protein [Acholeplasmatales bacterium]
MSEKEPKFKIGECLKDLVTNINVMEKKQIEGVDNDLDKLITTYLKNDNFDLSKLPKEILTEIYNFVKLLDKNNPNIYTEKFKKISYILYPNLLRTENYLKNVINKSFKDLDSIRGKYNIVNRSPYSFTNGFFTIEKIGYNGKICRRNFALYMIEFDTLSFIVEIPPSKIKVLKTKNNVTSFLKYLKVL